MPPSPPQRRLNLTPYTASVRVSAARGDGQASSGAARRRRRREEAAGVCRTFDGRPVGQGQAFVISCVSHLLWMLELNHFRS